MSERRLDLDQLRTFLAVVRRGSFTKAAEDVHLTQSAVSRQMRDLERSVGTTLFERLGRGVHLTAAGRALVRQAETMVLHAQDTLRLIEEIDAGVAGELRVGATVTAANYFLPEVLAAYRRAFPGVRLLLAPAPSPKLLSQVRRGELDVALLGHESADEDIRTWGMVRDEFVVVAPAAHPLAGRRKVAPGAFAKEDLILREPASDTRMAVERWAHESGVHLRVLMDMW